MNENMEQSEVELESDNENIRENTHPTGSDDDSILGELPEKFANWAELCKAYSSLHARFTKKCQEFADLKEQAAGKVSVTEQLSAQETASDNKAPSPERIANTDNAVSDAAVTIGGDISKETLKPGKDIMNDSTLREEVIRKYLLSVAAGKTAPAVIANTTNDFAFTNVAEVKSMNAISQIAQNFFETKKQGS